MNYSRFYLSLILVSSLFNPLQAEEDKPSQEGLEFFEQKIRPVLVQHCYQCHAVDAKNIQGGLLVDSKAGLLKGGDSAPQSSPRISMKALLLPHSNSRVLRCHQRASSPTL